MNKKLFLFFCIVLITSCSKAFPQGPDFPNEISDGTVIDGIYNVILDETLLGLDDDPSFTDSETILSTDEDFVENSSFSSQVSILFQNSSVTTSSLPTGVTATISNGDIVINSSISGVEYILSGSTDDGMFKIYSDKKFKLTLSGVSITNNDGPAINIQSSKRAFIVLNNENSLCDGASYAEAVDDEDQKGCFFSEAQLIFSGSGSLSVTGKYKHAIVCDDYVKFRPGTTITIPASVGDGIHVNEAIYIRGGHINVSSVGDAVQCEDGIIEVSGGTTIVSTTGDKAHGLKSFSNISFSNGAFKASTTGGASKGISSDANILISGGTIITKCTGTALYDSDEKDVSSPSGIKCDSTLVISGGSITAYSSGNGGKGISSDGNMDISNADIKIITKGKTFTYDSLDALPKGIKSDGNLTINSGTISIQTKGGEGSEAMESKKTLTINGGEIHIVAYDDCINASSSLVVNGGTIYCFSDRNDAFDSNGTLTINGGLLIGSGTTQPEEAFDCDQNTFSINGGTIVGISGATSSPTSNSCKQNSLIYGGSGIAENTLFNISRSSGESILTIAVPRTYNEMTILFSSPSLTKDSYILSSGGTISGSTPIYFYYPEGTYSGGTKIEDVSVSAVVTTVGNVSTGPGGGGNPWGGGGWRP